MLILFGIVCNRIMLYLRTSYIPVTLLQPMQDGKVTFQAPDLTINLNNNNT